MILRVPEIPDRSTMRPGGGRWSWGKA